MKIALCIKKDKPYTVQVRQLLQRHTKNLYVAEGRLGEPLPPQLIETAYDMVISYMSPWIIPAKVLKKTALSCINFHPGPPEYPGIGCFNFALYNEEPTYGVTAHVMAKKVDSGRIIGVKRFKIDKHDSVYTLSCKSYETMYALFIEIMPDILRSGKLPECGERWQRPAYLRKELEDLCRINSGMSKEEIKRRIRATVYPSMPGPYMELNGYIFEYVPRRGSARR